MTKRLAIRAGALALALALPACADVFAPGPGMDPSSFESQSAECRMFARGNTGGPGFFAASGSPRFVAASMGGYAMGAAIGMAITMKANYRDCMEARGWHLVQQNVPIAAAPGSTGVGTPMAGGLAGPGR